MRIDVHANVAGVATLERRVQVLFDPVAYESLRQLAASEGRSVGSVVREVVDQRLSSRRGGRRELAEQLLASARGQDQAPMPAWEDVKAGFERDHLAGIG
jgi:hypothetical protein